MQTYYNQTQNKKTNKPENKYTIFWRKDGTGVRKKGGLLLYC